MFSVIWFMSLYFVMVNLFICSKSLYSSAVVSSSLSKRLSRILSNTFDNKNQHFHWFLIHWPCDPIRGRRKHHRSQLVQLRVVGVQRLEAGGRRGQGGAALGWRFGVTISIFAFFSLWCHVLKFRKLKTHLPQYLLFGTADNIDPIRFFCAVFVVVAQSKINKDTLCGTRHSPPNCEASSF